MARLWLPASSAFEESVGITECRTVHEDELHLVLEDIPNTDGPIRRCDQTGDPIHFHSSMIFGVKSMKDGPAELRQRGSAPVLNYAQ